MVSRVSSGYLQNANMKRRRYRTHACQVSCVAQCRCAGSAHPILDHVRPLKLQSDYGTRALTRVSNEASALASTLSTTLRRELTFSNSLLSPAVFTTTLLPLLTQTAKQTESDVRIVFVRLFSWSVVKPVLDEHPTGVN